MEVKELFSPGGPLFHLHLGKPYSLQVSNQLLGLLDRQVTAGSRTLETGAGVTTVLFAMKGCRHTCITPDAGEIERIRAYCRERGVADDRIQFEVGRSETLLPRLAPEPLDLVLIDGAHGFPVPLIDWYYTADRIAVNGKLILDDTQLWSVKILEQFLSCEPEWRLETHPCPKSALLTKVRAGKCAKGHRQQLFVMKQTLELLYPNHRHWIRDYHWQPLEQRGARQLLKRALRFIEKRL